MAGNCAPILIDSHVHLDDQRLNSHLEAVVQAARSANVAAMVVPATTHDLWPRVKSVCAEIEEAHACYGLHPCFCLDHDDEHIANLSIWIAREHPVAVGECGLDYQISNADKAKQQQIFSAQLALAREFDLPVVIHARKAVEDVIRMVRSSGHYNGMVHSFNGSLQQAHRLIDLGYKISLGGAVTYPRATRLQALAAKLPLDSLLLETDAPDQTDVNHAGELNQPAFLIDVWQIISQLRSESSLEVAKRTTANAAELFGLPVAEAA
ncbi:MAG: TatD family hydrolase [Gammaproteobacteria bacterium]|nr:TatD family hydrolase [Gammaproteobacteria bacterium]